MIYEKFSALMASGIPLQNALELTGIAKDPQFPLISFAIRSGAPLTLTLSSLALHQEKLQVFQREITAAQAVPRATRKLMLWLPALGLVMGELLGLKTLAALSTTLGLVTFLLGLTFIYLGFSLTGRMLQKAQANQDLPGEAWFRLGVLLSAGEPLSAAISKSGLSDSSNQLVELALNTGARLTDLIAAQQREEIAEFASEKINQAKALAVSLLVPLGLTTLPAFLLFTIVPMLIGINQQ